MAPIKPVPSLSLPLSLRQRVCNAASARSLDQRPSNRPLSNAERPACLLLISRNYHVIFLVRLSGGGGGGGGGRIRSTSCGKAKAKGERGSGRRQGSWLSAPKMCILLAFISKTQWYTLSLRWTI